MRRFWSRLSFRGQLIVMTAGVFIMGGATLLIAQYLVLSAMLSEAVTVHNDKLKESGTASGNQGLAPDGASIEVIHHGPRWTQSDPVVTEVLAGVQLGSAMLLLAFTVLAIGGAWLLSRRALRRISEVTQATNTITEHDLSKRLALPGPDDEIKRLGSAIDGMIERLEGAFARQSAFIANASHEFRTPLATTRTVLQVATRQGRVPSELMSEVADVLDANRRLEELVGALLVVAQGRADIDLTRSRVDLTGLVTQALREHADLAQERGISVDVTLPERPLVVDGNEPLLYSMFTNLISNATRHNVEGGFIRILLATEGHRAVLSVENPGAAMPPELVVQLTEPFQRGDRSRTRNEDGSEAGTGLGLTLVESIVGLHDGVLMLEPRERGGLIVTVGLRMGDAESAPGRHRDLDYALDRDDVRVIAG